MKAENSDKKEFVIPPKNTVQVDNSGQNIFFESGGEYVLPDYMPKVEKLLRAETKVLPPARYISGNEAQMSGNLLHSLIYIGDEGEVSATVLPSKYDFAVPYSSESGNCEIIASPVIDNVNCRLSGPRKVNIRSKLHGITRVIEEKDITPAMPEDTNGLHTLCGEIDSVRTKVLRMDNVTVSETVEINDTEDARLIWCGANAAVTDLRVSDGGVQVRGDIYVKVLSANGSVAKMHTKRIPFEEFLDGELSRKAMVSAGARVISTEASREQGGEALVDVTVCIEAVADMQDKVNVMFDAFSEYSNADVEYHTVPCTRAVTCRSGVYNVSGSLPLSALQGFTEMLDASGEAAIDEVSAEGGKITLGGRNNMHFIFNTDGGYSSYEAAIPFKIVLDAEAPQKLEVIPSASLLSVRTRNDGEKLVCDMEVAVSVRALEKKECQAVKKISTDKTKTYEKCEHPLCLIYPKGESLWSLSKKYHISPKKLVKINMLDIDESRYTSKEALADSKILMLQF